MSGKYLLKNVKVADPNSTFNHQNVDIFIEDGIITQMGVDLNKRAETISIPNAIVYPGFCDLYVDFCDPGLEHRENFASGIRAAISGGFTAVCTIPDTHPVVQSKGAIEYSINQGKGSGVQICPLGAVSEDLKGIAPTEMYDMHQAGAKGFTDAKKSIKNSGLLLRALQYVQPFDGVIFDLATDESLANHGEINEGEMSVRLGMKGIPHIAEIVHLKRNIEILRYTGGRLHIYGITTKEGVSLIKKAKKEGLLITASVFVHHLLFTDEDLHDYNTNFKINPPFRTAKDKLALQKGLLEGTIDCISTQHTPIELDGKKLEFEYASPGLIGLETAYAAVKMAFGDKANDEMIANWMSVQPRKIMQLETIKIEVKQKANFMVVDENAQWTVTEKSLHSKSKNTPFIGKTLTGKVKAVFNEAKWLLNE
jgi:dihydroorotase